MRFARVHIQISAQRANSVLRGCSGGSGRSRSLMVARWSCRQLSHSWGALCQGLCEYRVLALTRYRAFDPRHCQRPDGAGLAYLGSPCNVQNSIRSGGENKSFNGGPGRVALSDTSATVILGPLRCRGGVSVGADIFPWCPLSDASNGRHNTCQTNISHRHTCAEFARP